ncbi:hypothetical protein ABIA09_001165 [Bradyrhizobium yuanmingense]
MPLVSSFFITVSTIFSGLEAFEVERVDVAGEARDIAVAEIGDHLGRMLQRREAEERRGRDAAERPLHRCKAFLDLVLALRFVELLVVQVGVRPGVGADGVAGCVDLLEDLRLVGRVLADDEEDSGGAFVRECLQHRGRVARPGAVVEGQHDLLVAQEVELLEMLEAEAGTTRGVDLDRAGDAEGARRVAGRAGRLRRLFRRGRIDEARWRRSRCCGRWSWGRCSRWCCRRRGLRCGRGLRGRRLRPCGAGERHRHRTC